MRLPTPRELRAAQKALETLLPAAQEMTEALDNLAEVHGRWLTGWPLSEEILTDDELSAAIRRVLDARVTGP